jgi:hypothetical protein
MHKIVMVVFGASSLASLAYSAVWSGDWRTLKGSYTIYSGELAERDAPTATERKMTIAVDGGAAKEIFDSIAPDVYPTCSQEKGDRERRKKGVECTYTSQGTGKGYRCWIGINLRTGDSIPTVSC